MRRVRSECGVLANGCPACSARHAAVTRPCGPLARDGACRVGPSVRGGAGGGPQHASEADSAPKNNGLEVCPTCDTPLAEDELTLVHVYRCAKGGQRAHVASTGPAAQSSVCANGGRCAHTQNRNTSRSLDAGVFYRKMARRAHQVPHANKPTRIYATYGAPRLKYASRAMRSHPHPRAARASATRDTARTHMASDMAPVPPKASRPRRSPAPLNLVI